MDPEEAISLVSKDKQIARGIDWETFLYVEYRTDDQIVPSWSGLNHRVSKSDHPKAIAGMMPIINYP